MNRPLTPFMRSGALPAFVLALTLRTGLPAAAQAAGPSDATAPLRPIARLDVPRYMGTWYEVARFPNRFQAQCLSDTSAQYRLRPDGRVDVLNQCRQADGQVSKALGEARQTGPATLEVRFAPAWLSFLPMVWGDYWVIDLDEGYTLSAVSEPSRQYLWVLSRTPVVDEARYQALIQRLKQQGLAVDNLVRQGQGQGQGQGPKP